MTEPEIGDIVKISNPKAFAYKQEGQLLRRVSENQWEIYFSKYRWSWFFYNNDFTVLMEEEPETKEELKAEDGTE